jgi:hypothetical protein
MLHLVDLIVEAGDLILQRVDLLAVGGDGVAQVLVGRLLIVLRHGASADGECANQDRAGAEQTAAASRQDGADGAA